MARVRLLRTVLLLAACVSGCAPKPVYLLGITAWPSHEFLYLAQEQGYFVEEGVDVRVVEVGSRGDLRLSLERGQLDAAAMTIPDFLAARDAGRTDLEVAWVLGVSHGGDVLLARPDVADLADLRGRRVGVDTSLTSAYLLARALATVGLRLDDVTMVPTDLAAGEPQWPANNLDALVSHDPAAARLMGLRGVRLLFDSASVPGEMLDVLVMSQALVHAPGSPAAGILRAYTRARDFARQDPDRAFQLMAAREGITRNAFAEALTAHVQMLEPDQQPAYFGSHGRLSVLTEQTGNALRAAGLLNRPVQLPIPRQQVLDVK